MNVSVVIPVYNSSAILPELLERLEKVLEEHYDAYELILVNDGSRDSSWQVICSLVDERAWITGIDLMRNYGQHNALLCGIRAARHEVIVTMDDDLQHPPEEVPKLTSKLAEGYDVVYGTPQEEQHGLLRDVASRITKMALQSAMGVDNARNVSAFRAFRTKVRDSFDSFRVPFVSIDVLLTWGTTRFSAVRVRHDPRRYSRSNYTVGRLLNHAFNMMTGFSTIPLQLASVMGFSLTFLGVVLLCYLLMHYYMIGGGVPGFTFLACVITIFSGTQLLVLGIMGEYLARMHFRTMDRPTYVMRERIIGSKDKDSSEKGQET